MHEQDRPTCVHEDGRSAFTDFRCKIKGAESFVVGWVRVAAVLDSTMPYYHPYQPTAHTHIDSNLDWPESC